MFMHDHTKPKREPMYCTLMKGICREGWTEAMGEDPVTKVRPKCHKWVGVFVNNPTAKPPISEVFDCNEQWQSDLVAQVAQEVYQNARATEEVRNRVAENNGFNRIALSFFEGIARRIRAQVILPEMQKPPELGHQENSNGNGTPN